MSLKATPLETKIREALKEHQHEGLHMIGGVDQLVAAFFRPWNSGWTKSALLAKARSVSYEGGRVSVPRKMKSA